MTQQTLMRFDPAEGTEKPYPSHAAQWREYHGKKAWLFNPWTGQRRFAGDVGDDPFGNLIRPEGEPPKAAERKFSVDFADIIVRPAPTRDQP